MLLQNSHHLFEVYIYEIFWQLFHSYDKYFHLENRLLLKHRQWLPVYDDDHIDQLGQAAPVSRIMVRQPNNKGNAGSSTNGMPPTSSMGCGTWGGNIVSENITLKHYMNTTWVSRPIPEDMPSLQELLGVFYRDGMDEEWVAGKGNRPGKLTKIKRQIW